jgi:nitrite reductase (NO-forming)
VAVLGGVHTGRPVLTAAGAWLVGAVVLAHAIALGAWIGRALTGPLAGTVWFYVAASAALLAGRGLGVRLAGGGPASTDAYRAMRLAHSHLNVLDWVGLAVVGTQFTLWPTVLRTRMVPGVGRAVRWSLATMVMGLAAATAGLLGQAGWWSSPAWPAKLPGWPSPSAPSCGRFCAAGRTRRPPGCSAPVWAGWPSPSSSTWSHWPAAHRSSISTSGSTGWSRPSRSACPAGPDRRLTYLLPVVFGRGVYGNRKLTGVLEATWPLRVAAVNLGVVLLVAGSPGGWAARAGWWLAVVGFGAFVPLAAAVLAWRLVEDAGRLTPSAEARLAGHHIPSGRGIKVRSAHRGPVTAPAVVMGSQPARREAADHLGRVTAQPRSGFRSGSVRCQAAAPAGSG